MAIDGGLRDKMVPGMVLGARYRKAEHTCTVVADPEREGSVLYRLEDGSTYRSPSAAGSALMGGIACNGWRFWSLTDAKAAQPKAAKQPKAKAVAAPTEAAGTRPRCPRCGKHFIGAKQLAHHEANADRLCKVAA